MRSEVALAGQDTYSESVDLAGRRYQRPGAHELDPAVLKQLALSGELCDVVAAHRLAQVHGGGGYAGGVLGVGGRLDDRAGAALGVGRLEDAGADEVALGAELHRERRVSGSRDAAGAEERNGKPAGLGDLGDEVEGCLELLGG